VVNAELGHSDTVFSVGYPERFWLPYLWDFDPARYADLLNACEELFNLDHDRAAIEDRIRAFSEMPWVQGETTVGEYLAERIRTHCECAPKAGRQLRNFTNMSLRNLYAAVAIAQNEAGKTGPKSGERIRALNPVTAAFLAVDAALHGGGKHCAGPETPSK